MSSKVLLIPATIVALSLAPAAAQSGKFVRGTHQDPVSGYKIKIPDKWRMVPVKIDEKWISAKYICGRKYTNKGSGLVVAHTPDLNIIVFTEEKTKRENRVEVKDDTAYAGSKGTVFRNYEDYLKHEMSARRLGYFIASQEEDKIGDIPVKKYRITAETDFAKFTYLAWTYKRPDDSMVAVQFSVLEDRLNMLERDFERSFKSFRFVERTETADEVDLENPMWMRDREKWRELGLAEREKIRREMQDKRRQLYIDTAPQGWFTMESKKGRYIALSHSDKTYTKRVLDAAEAIHDWLEERVGDVSDEYVMTGIVRVCADRAEFASYRNTTAEARSFSADDREIVDYKVKALGTAGGGLLLIGRGVLDNYANDKDSYLFSYSPAWIMAGLGNIVGKATVRGGKLSFKAPVVEKTYLRRAERDDKIRTFKELITTNRYDWPKDRENYNQFLVQVITVTRWLDGPGKKQKLLKDFLTRYAKATIAAAEEWRKQQKGRGQAETVEEEEKRARERSESGRKRREFILETVTAELCNFSDKEWAQIEKAWKKFVTK